MYPADRLAARLPSSLPEIHALLQQAQGMTEDVQRQAWTELQQFRTEALEGVKEMVK